jgi:hypothetical protein
MKQRASRLTKAEQTELLQQVKERLEGSPVSRASEWARARPKPFRLSREDITVAMVDEVSGGMILNETPKDSTLTQVEAIKFARWIIDTFGEPHA